MPPLSYFSFNYRSSAERLVAERRANNHRRDSRRNPLPCAPADFIDLSDFFTDPGTTSIRLTTVLGEIEIALYDLRTPLTVANFLRYINEDRYFPNDSTTNMPAPLFVHRAIPGFVIQSGGFVATVDPSDPVHILATHTLGVGNNNLSTTFSGVIQESGGLIKIGTGTFILRGPNTYTGGTKVSGGVLLTNSSPGSSTGSGPVKVTAGSLGGQGIIGGR